MVRRKKILVVDQDLLSCRSYQKLFEKAGFKVDCCLDGQEAQFIATNSSYDCILIDVNNLPKVDGWEVVLRLKSNDHNKNTPIVIFTELDGDHYYEKARKVGADGFVAKFQPAQVLTEVKKILRGAAKGNLR